MSGCAQNSIRLIDFIVPIRIGEILSALYEAQLDGEFSDLDGGLALLHKMLENGDTL